MKKLFEISLLCLIASSYVTAQNLGNLQRYTLDSSDAFVEFNLNSSYGSTTFDNQTIDLFVNGGKFTNEMKDQSRDRLNEINRAGGGYSYSLYYSNPTSYLFKDFGYFIAAQVEENIGFEFTEDAYNLTFYGNQSFINDTAYLQRTGFSRQGYKSITFGLNQFNRLRVGITYLNYGYNDFATVQQGYVYTDTVNQEILAKVNTTYNQFSTSNSSLWNSRGNGLAINFEWFIPLNPEKPEQMLVAGVQNFGIQWSKVTSTQVDTTYLYSGFNINSITDFGESISAVDLKDTLQIKQSNIRYNSLIPFVIYFYKLPDSKKVSSLYGFRYQVNSLSIPLVYAGAQFKIGNKGALSSTVNYGYFQKFGLGIAVQKRYDHFSLNLNSRDILGLISKKGFGKSFNVSLMYRI